MPNACGRMIVAACSRMPRHRLPFMSNIAQHNSEVIAMCAAAKRASAWGIGAEVCMRTGHRRPSVHVQGAPEPKCACEVQRNQTLKPESPKPQTFNPKP